MPVALTMATVGFVGFGVLSGFKSAMNLLSMDLFSSFASYNLSVVAMFTLMGYFAYYSGIGAKLFEFAYRCVGHMPGGMAMASEGACAAFGALCGSGPATVSTIGAIAYPEMKKYKYDDTISTASVASGGGLGLLIPPSITAIVYGVMTENSIGKLFIGGIGAGLLLTLLFCIMIFILVKRNPALAPKGERFTLREIMASVKGGLIETLIIFVLTIGGLSLGWFTPTEGGAIGAFAMLAVCLIRRKLAWKAFVSACFDTAKTVGMALLLVACATIFGRFVAVAQIPQGLAEGLGNLSLPPFGVFLIIIVIYLIGGCFLDGLPLIMITVPIFYPIVMQLGFDPIWFGVIITLVCCMGMITPPVGVNVFIMSGVAKDVPLEKIFKGVWPFLMCILTAIVLCMIWPEIILGLPRLLKY
jgi:tripartite ATP-independent transporter DctM subunit